MNKKFVFVMLFVSSFTIFACAPRSAPVEKPSFPGTGALQVQATGKEAWEVEWEKAVVEGKREGKLMAYVYSGPEVREAVGKAVREKYGIEISWVAGSGRELAARTFNERKAGLYIVDFSISGTSTALNILKPAGVLEPVDSYLILPEVLDSRAWYIGKLPYFEKAHMIFSFRASPTNTVTINTQMASKEEIVSYRDLLNPKWKGKMAWLDPTIGGSGNQFFSVVGEIIMGYDFMRELAKQEPVFTRDRRILVEWLARGKYAMAFGAETGQVKSFKEAGASIEEFTPKEGAYMTSGSGNVFIYNRAPHQNALKVFVNWLLSREGQNLLSRVEGYQSARVDVPTDHLPQTKIRQPDKKYFMADTEEWERDKEKRFELAGEIFGHLLR